MPKLGDRRPSVDLRVEEKSVLTVAEMLEKRLSFAKENLCWAVEKLTLSW
jgi:hypothetical protein